MRTSIKGISLSSLLLLSLAASCSLCSSQAESGQVVAVARYRDGPEFGGGSWLARVLRELFDDIDWSAIEKAREQVEKFVWKVDRLIKSFRAGNGAAGDRPAAAAAGGSADLNEGSVHNAAYGAGSGKEARVNLQGKWWNAGAKLAAGSPAALAGELADASDVKAMLERLACFLGYMRILTDSSAALAELDAAKVVSNLFGSTGASSGGGGGYFKRWFG